MPLDVQAVDEADVVARYETRLVLVRPDGLVAWRGNAMPADPRAILDTARGAAPAPVSAGDAQPHAVTELVT